MPARAGAGRPASKKLSAARTDALIRAEYPDFHAVLEMVRSYHNDELSIDQKHGLLRDIAKYTSPQLKAIELQPGGEGELRIKWKS